MRRPPGCGKSRSVESEENQKQVFLPSHRPWESRTTRAIPTFPTAPTAAGISTSLITKVGVGPNETIKRGQIKLTKPLFGSAGRQATQLHDLSLSLGNFFAVGPAISLPLFTGGRIRSNIAVQNALWKQTLILYQSTVLNSLEETENALVNYSQEQERRDRLQAAVSQNQTALKLSQELYTSGLGDFLGVLDAERQLYGNEDLLAQSQTAVTTNLIALYKALGGGWESFPQQ